jgi:drug/metabolite transporter (DMT)-like permease
MIFTVAHDFVAHSGQPLCASEGLVSKALGKTPIEMELGLPDIAQHRNPNQHAPTHMKLSKQAVGTILALVSSIGFAVVPSITKTVYEHGANPLGVNAPRFTFSAVVMIVVRVIFGSKEKLPSLKNAISICVLGIFGITSVSLLYMVAIEEIDTGFAIVLWYGYPIVILAFAWVFQKSRPTIGLVVPLGIMFVGVIFSAGQLRGGTGTAVTQVFLSSLFYAGYLLVLERVSKTSGVLTGVALLNIGGALGYWVVCMFSTESLSPVFPSKTSDWFAIFALSVLGTAIPILCSLAGLRRLSASQFSIVATTEPIWVIFFGVIFLAERPTVGRNIGAVLVIGGLIVYSYLNSRSTQTAVAAPHEKKPIAG